MLRTNAPTATYTEGTTIGKTKTGGDALGLSEDTVGVHLFSYPHLMLKSNHLVRAGNGVQTQEETRLLLFLFEPPGVRRHSVHFCPA